MNPHHIRIEVSAKVYYAIRRRMKRRPAQTEADAIADATVDLIRTWIKTEAQNRRKEKADAA